MKFFLFWMLVFILVGCGSSSSSSGFQPSVVNSPFTQQFREQDPLPTHLVPPGPEAKLPPSPQTKLATIGHDSALEVYYPWSHQFGTFVCRLLFKNDGTFISTTNRGTEVAGTWFTNFSKTGVKMLNLSGQSTYCSSDNTNFCMNFRIGVKANPSVSCEYDVYPQTNVQFKELRLSGNPICADPCFIRTSPGSISFYVND